MRSEGWVPGKLTKTLWVLRMSFHSCLQLALSSAPLLSLWSLAVAVTFLPPWLRSISPECALPPRACLPVYRSSLRAHMLPVLDIAPLIFWELASLVPWTYQGFLFQPQCRPQVLCSQWSPLDFTPFHFFLGEICSLQSPWIFGTPLPQIKFISGSKFCFQRQKRGTRGNGIHGVCIGDRKSVV